MALIKLADNVLKITANWGTLKYQGLDHRIYNLHIKSPSDHRINGVSYPLEFQYSAVSPEGTEVLLCFLFERNDFQPLPVLYNYGLGNEGVKELTTFDKDTENSRLYLRTKLAIDDLVDVGQQAKLPFYFYEGSNPNAACGLAINMVYAEPLWVGNEQLSIFSMAAAPDFEAREDYKTLVYQNQFDQTRFPMLHNATGAKSPMQESPFAGPLTHLPFLFMPEAGRILGNLNETFFAVWRPKPTNGVFVEPESPPQRRGPYRFLLIGWRQFRVPDTDLLLYVAQYVMTGAKVELPADQIPGSLPVYLRANYSYPNGVRPIVAARMKLNETERLSVSAAHQAAKDQASSTTLCRKWRTSVVVNRNFDQEASYRNVSDSVQQALLNNQCADYVTITHDSAAAQAEENKVDVEDPDIPGSSSGAANGGSGKSGGSGSSSSSAGGGADAGKSGKRGDPFGLGGSGLSGLNKYMQQAAGVFCFTQLHVILNRRYTPNVGDYSYSGCRDPTQTATDGKPAVEQGATSLAQTDLRRLALHSGAPAFMHGQQALGPLL